MERNVLVDWVSTKKVSEKLGGFRPIFGDDLKRFHRWGKLSRQLIDDMLDFQPDGSELRTPYRDQDFQQLTEKVTQFTANSLKSNKVPYHNLEHHRTVAKHIATFDEKVEQIAEQSIIADIVKQASYIAGLLHDAFHHGESARVGERGTMHRPELGKETDHVSVEAVSALEADNFLAEETKYSAPARMFISALILATHREAKPVSYHFAKIRMADIAPVGDFSTIVDHQIALNYGRLNSDLEVINFKEPGTTIEKMADDMKQFRENVVASEMNRFDEAVKHFVQHNPSIPNEKKESVLATLNDEPLTQQLGMRDQWKREIEAIRALQKGSTDHRRIVLQKLQQHGLAIDDHDKSIIRVNECERA